MRGAMRYGRECDNEFRSQDKPSPVPAFPAHTRRIGTEGRRSQRRGAGRGAVGGDGLRRRERRSSDGPHRGAVLLSGAGRTVLAGAGKEGGVGGVVLVGGGEDGPHRRRKRRWSGRCCSCRGRGGRPSPAQEKKVEWAVLFLSGAGRAALAGAGEEGRVSGKSIASKRGYGGKIVTVRQGSGKLFHNYFGMLCSTMA